MCICFDKPVYVRPYVSSVAPPQPIMYARPQWTFSSLLPWQRARPVPGQNRILQPVFVGGDRPIPCQVPAYIRPRIHHERLPIYKLPIQPVQCVPPISRPNPTPGSISRPVITSGVRQIPGTRY